MCSNTTFDNISKVLDGIEQLDQGKLSSFDKSIANRIKKKGRRMLASKLMTYDSGRKAGD